MDSVPKVFLSTHLTEFMMLGDYCPFLHQTERPLCKFYLSPEGCRRGNSCTFSHRTVPKEPKKYKPVQLIDKVEVPEQKPVTHFATNPVNQLWGFDSHDENYFYGTVGAMDHTHSSRPYADVLGHSDASEDEVRTISKPSSVPVICPFYIYGSCLYGSNCRNIHSLDGSQANEFENMLMNEEIEAAKRAECGICLCPIEDKSLGMLSNCWCTFCLECIRSWRKEGATFSKSSHVR